MACISSAYALLHDCPEGNRKLYEAIKRYPSRFIPFCAVNPRYIDEARDELRKYIKEIGWKGVKLHPELHYYMAKEIQRIEIFGMGRMVRVYTRRFVASGLGDLSELPPIIMAEGTGRTVCF